MSKIMRQYTILSLVAQGKAPNQAMLADELRKRGFKANQANVSRDITELNLAKSRCGYVRTGSSSLPIPNARETIGLFLRRVNQVGNLVTIGTVPRSARHIARMLEQGGFGRVVSVVAGWDTCLVILESAEAADSFRRSLLKTLSGR